MMISPSTRRVVVTGMGVISPLGNSKEALWDALISGRSGVRPIESLATNHLPASFAAEAWNFQGRVDEFGPLQQDRKKAIRKGLKVMCRETQMGVAAAQLALDDARLQNGQIDPERSGVVFGSDYMLTLPEEFIEGVRRCEAEDGGFDYSRWATDGLSQMQPLWLLKYLPNMPASHIAIYNDMRGPNNSITHREAAANLAVGEAFFAIVRGAADNMIAGATGTRVHPMKAVHAAQSEQLAVDSELPQTASRPFDLNRTGMVLGEGAGAILLEELQSAKARGAPIYAEIIGAASSSVLDPHSVAYCDKALANAMRSCLTVANTPPEAVDHIHAHGLSTWKCDAEEAEAIGQVFGQRAGKIPIVAAKSHFGNLGAGSGMVELIGSITGLLKGHLFPVLNYQTPDPQCPISPVTSPDTAAGNRFLNLSTTPQGQASVVMIQSYG